MSEPSSRRKNRSYYPEQKACWKNNARDDQVDDDQGKDEFSDVQVQVFFRHALIIPSEHGKTPGIE